MDDEYDSDEDVYMSDVRLLATCIGPCFIKADIASRMMELISMFRRTRAKERI